MGSLPTWISSVALLVAAATPLRGAGSSGAGKSSGLDEELRQVQQAERDSDAEAQAIAGQLGNGTPEIQAQARPYAGAASPTAKAAKPAASSGAPRISGSRIDPRVFGREPAEDEPYLEHLKQIPRKPLNIPTPSYQPVQNGESPGSVEYDQVAGRDNPTSSRGALPYLPTWTQRARETGHPAQTLPAAKTRDSHFPSTEPPSSASSPTGKRVKRRVNNPMSSGEEESPPLLRSAEEKMQVGDFEGALEDAQRAAQADPQSAQARLLLAQALSALGRFEEAEQAASQSIRLAPEDAAAYEVLAWAQLNLGKDRQAAASASQALLLDPENAFAYAIRAYAYERLRQDDAKLRDLAVAARLHPAAFGAQLKRAQAGQKVGPLFSSRSRADERPPAARLRFLGSIVLAGLALPFLAMAAYFFLPRKNPA